MQKNNEKLFEAKFTESDYVKPGFPEGYLETFLMKTSYPGLLAGSGYAHGTGASDYDVNMGFSLDYVSGQPYIPGSSVKGVLRSCFKKPDVIREVAELQKEFDVAALEKDIFEGDDIFFDAVIRMGDKNGHIIGEDYITPHGKDLTENPTPILFIKVLPEVVFEFRFHLTDSVAKDGSTLMEKNEKIKLFKNLIEILGIGAKTNEGYGALTFTTEDELTQERTVSQAGTAQAQPGTGQAQPGARQAQPARTDRHKLPQKIECTIVDVKQIIQVTFEGRKKGYIRRDDIPADVLNTLKKDRMIWCEKTGRSSLLGEGFRLCGK